MSQSQAVRAIDVADYVLQKLGALSAMKVQKLVYYAQAWTLVWTDNPLFWEDIEAWADGPVVRTLYAKHRGHFRLEPAFFEGDPTALSLEQSHAINQVVGFYGTKDAQWLSDLTHMESPWIEARKGLAPGERGTVTISRESMLSYYSSL